MLESIDGCPAPVVARIQGHALGGGAGLVACFDIGIAGPDAFFAFSEVKLGIMPAVISPIALAKIGAAQARRYFLTGERFDADVALRIGLVQEVATDLDAAVERVVEGILAGGAVSGARSEAPRPRARRGGGTARTRSGPARERRGAGWPARVPGETFPDVG